MSQFDDPSGAMPPSDPDGEGGDGRIPPLDDGSMGEPSAGADEVEAAGADDPVAGPWGVPTGPVPYPGAPTPIEVPVPQETLDKKVVIYWLLSGLMSWSFITVFLGGGAALVYVKWPEAWRYVMPAVVTLLGTLLVWVLISPSLAFGRWRFRVDSELLLARYGIFFIEEKAIPISRLQHVDLYRGLLERFFGLTTLIVFTAGTEGAHFRLPGLSVARARELRDVILAARGDDVI